MKKRALRWCALMLCAFMLCGCSAIYEKPYVPQSREGGGYEPGEPFGRTATVALYFFDPAESRLVSELRTITIEDDNILNAVMRELALGTDNDELTGVIPVSAEYERSELTGNTANVYFKLNGAIDSRSLYIARAAIANTLTGAVGINYVNVYIDGMAPAILGAPAGAQGKFTGSVDGSLAELESIMPSPPTPEDENAGEENPGEEEDGRQIPSAQAWPSSQELPVTLYFASNDDVHILGETRKIAFKNGNYAEAIIDELIKGPSDAFNSRMIVDRMTKLASPPEITLKDDGTLALTLDFRAYPRFYEEGRPERDTQTLAAIVYTFTGFLPGVSEVIVKSNGKEISTPSREPGQGFTRSYFSGKPGNIYNVYLMSQNEGLLKARPRVLSSQEFWSPEARLKSLFAGPVATDPEDAWPVLPSRASANDLISVGFSGDTAQVNLTRNFLNACRGMDKEGEMLLVYSIVNMMCDMTGVKQVVLLIEGKTADFNGHINTRQALLKNPGIIDRG